MPSKLLKNSPLSELAISASTKGGPLYDAYTVQRTHDLIRDNYPIIERQAGIVEIEPFPDMTNAPLSVPVPQFVAMPQESSRWWFISTEKSRLIQLQENFVSINWRRQSLPPDAPSGAAYPGFEAMMRQFQATVAHLLSDCQRHGRPEPTPTVAEVFYDNLIPATIGDERLKLPDILKFIKFQTDGSEPRKTALSFNWLEKLPQPSGLSGQMQITLQQVRASMPSNDEVRPFLKLVMIARCAVKSWDEAWHFHSDARSYAASRLRALTTAKIRRTWT